jgi:hypothetical protein
VVVKRVYYLPWGNDEGKRIRINYPMEDYIHFPTILTCLEFILWRRLVYDNVGWNRIHRYTEGSKYCYQIWRDEECD